VSSIIFSESLLSLVPLGFFYTSGSTVLISWIEQG